MTAPRRWSRKFKEGSVEFDLTEVRDATSIEGAQLLQVVQAMQQKPTAGQWLAVQRGARAEAWFVPRKPGKPPYFLFEVKVP